MLKSLSPADGDWINNQYILYISLAEVKLWYLTMVSRNKMSIDFFYSVSIAFYCVTILSLHFFHISDLGMISIGRKYTRDVLLLWSELCNWQSQRRSGFRYCPHPLKLPGLIWRCQKMCVPTINFVWPLHTLRKRFRIPLGCCYADANEQKYVIERQNWTV